MADNAAEIQRGILDRGHTRLSLQHQLAIVAPYVADKFKDQALAVLPIASFLFLFQLVVIRRHIEDAFGIALGLTAVILGLMFFMEGLRLGLMPLGQSIGATLPEKARPWLVFGFAFILGVIATLAEPAISTLKAAGSNVQPGDAVLLYELLNRGSGILVVSVAVGVGIATVLGVLRFLAHWSLKRLLLPTLALALVSTVLAELHPATRTVIALAWDTGAITTGPVTVPLVLALGLGVATVLGKSDTGMSGFGIVTLASLWPVTIVLLAALAIFYSGGYLPADEAARLAAGAGGAVTGSGPSLVELIGVSMQAAIQAILPLAALLFVVQRLILREPVRHGDQILLGLVFAVIGLLLFNVGLGAGLVRLGQQVGSNVPVAFAPPEQLYGEVGGRLITLAFAFVLGYGATLAEPALNAMGRTVEDVTVGAFRKTFLTQAVALGVGVGLAVGIARIMFDWPMAYLLIPGYLLLIPLTLASDEKFVNVGWDSAGVTTGPITVPLVLAKGLGIGMAVGVTEGFGMLAMASVGPIVAVLVIGLILARIHRPAAAPAYRSLSGPTPVAE